MTASNSTARKTLHSAINSLFDVGSLIDSASAQAERDMEGNIDIFRVLKMAGKRINTLATELGDIEMDHHRELKAAYEKAKEASHAQ